MKKSVVLIIIITTVVSCTAPNYMFDNPAQTTGVNFTTGKWLLNEIDAPYNLQETLLVSAKEDFRQFVGNRLNYIHETRGLLVPPGISLNPDKKFLNNLKVGTGFDYFINIKAAHTRQDFGSVDLTPHKLDQGGTKSSEISIEIYDLNLEQIIYSQKIVASIYRPDDNKDIHFSKSSRGLILKAYKKLIKDIAKRSIK